MEIEVRHVSRILGKYKYMLDLDQYLSNRCDYKSKEKRIQIENSNQMILLEEFDHTINKSVNEFIRELDAKAELQHKINEKFKEHAQYIDVEARYSF